MRFERFGGGLPSSITAAGRRCVGHCQQSPDQTLLDDPVDVGGDLVLLEDLGGIIKVSGFAFIAAGDSIGVVMPPKSVDQRVFQAVFAECAEIYRLLRVEVGAQFFGQLPGHASGVRFPGIDLAAKGGQTIGKAIPIVTAFLQQQSAVMALDQATGEMPLVVGRWPIDVTKQFGQWMHETERSLGGLAARPAKRGWSSWV